MVYVLKGPRGGIIESTVSTTKQGAQAKAFNYLWDNADWARSERFWKQWDAFVEERRRRGYRVCQARLTVMAQVEE